MTRTRLPARSTVPSTTASTFSSPAIAPSDLRVPLYDITEVREITRNLPIFARSVMSSSVMPSTKYSCCGSLERFSSGRIAIERIGESDSPARTRRRPIPQASTASAITMATPKTTRRRALDLTGGDWGPGVASDCRASAAVGAAGWETITRPTKR